MKASTITTWLCVSLLCVTIIPREGVAYDVVDVTTPGRLHGHVDVIGTPLAPRTFNVQKNPDVCGETRTLTKVSVHDGKLEGAVVVIEGVTQGKPFAERTYRDSAPGSGTFHYRSGKTLDMEVSAADCSFGPYTGVVTPDQPIAFTNHDPMKHTLHTYVLRGTQAKILKTVHNRGIQPSTTIQQTFSSDKLPASSVVALTCDRHDFMENWLYPVHTPYYAMTDRDGAFVIDGIPPGHYHVTVWHPVLGTQTHALTVNALETTHTHFTLDQK